LTGKLVRGFESLFLRHSTALCFGSPLRSWLSSTFCCRVVQTSSRVNEIGTASSSLCVRTRLQVFVRPRRQEPGLRENSRSQVRDSLMFRPHANRGVPTLWQRSPTTLIASLAGLRWPINPGVKWLPCRINLSNSTYLNKMILGSCPRLLRYI
jgi:hypothetical protein